MARDRYNDFMPRPRFKAIAFRLLPTLAALVGFAAFYAGYRRWTNSAAAGLDLNRTAWAACFSERGETVPASGPRDGYWGSRLDDKKPDPEIGWREAPKSIPGLLEIDEAGLQRFHPRAAARFRVLIAGGSVAFGAYASSIDATYFAVLGRELEQQDLPTEITVFAAGAWKSSQEVVALDIIGLEVRPHLVLLLNGLNDLRNGATAKTVYGQEAATHDGSKWQLGYHALDFEQRADEYLAQVRAAAQLTARRKCPLAVVLQPSLAEKQHRTRLEEQLLINSLPERATAEDFRDGYAAMRRGLQELADSRGVRFVDASQVFGADDKQVFTDLWHFADCGHEALGQELARHVADVLKQAEAATPGSSPP